MRVGGLWLLAAGLFFVAGSVWLLSLTWRLYSTQRDVRTHAEHATATIVAFQQTQSHTGKSHRLTTFFAPIFDFTDHTGATRRVTSRVGHGDKPGYRVGETVPVVYHHDRPQEAELDTFFANWGGVLIAGGIGAAFFLVGGLVASVGTRRLLWPDRFLGPPANGGGPVRDPAVLSGS